jgi:hypothetical protein
MYAALAILAVSFALLVLAVPVNLNFRFRGIEAPEAHVEVGWLFGLVHHRIQLSGRARRTRSYSGPTRRGVRGAQVAAVLRQGAFRRRLMRLFRDLFNAAHVSDLAVRLRLGLGDPADTGRLWALVGPLSAVAQRLANAQISVQPEFIDAKLEFDVRGRMVIVPLQLLAVVMAFALSPPSIRAWRSIKAARA